MRIAFRLVIAVFILAVAWYVLTWLVRYLGMPDIAEKLVVVLCVLGLLFIIADLAGWVGTGLVRRDGP